MSPDPTSQVPPRISNRSATWSSSLEWTLKQIFHLRVRTCRGDLLFETPSRRWTRYRSGCPLGIRVHSGPYLETRIDGPIGRTGPVSELRVFCFCRENVRQKRLPSTDVTCLPLQEHTCGSDHPDLGDLVWKRWPMFSSHDWGTLHTRGR